MWGGGISCDGASLVPNKPRTGVLVSSFPPHAYAGIHPTLYLFGFWANALNSHSPYLPGFDPGSGLERFEVRCLGLFEKREAAGLGGLWGPASRPAGIRTLGLVVGFPSFWAPDLPLTGRPRNISISRPPSKGSLVSDPPERPARDPRRQGCWV